MAFRDATLRDAVHKAEFQEYWRTLKNYAEAHMQRCSLLMLPHGLVPPCVISLLVLVPPSELFVGDNTGSANILLSLACAYLVLHMIINTSTY